MLLVPNPEDWNSIFAEVFDELGSLKIRDDSHFSFEALNPLKCNRKDEGKYTCEICKRSWQSKNALAEFEYRLSKRNDNMIGEIQLILNGQSCRNRFCSKTTFIKPVFDKDAIQRILEKLLIKVKQKFYVFEDDEECEGCQKGTCRRENPTIEEPKKRRFKRHKSEAEAAPDIYVTWNLRLYSPVKRNTISADK